MQVHHRKYNPKLTCSYLHTSYLKHTKRFVLLPSTSEEDEAQGMSISWGGLSIAFPSHILLLVKENWHCPTGDQETFVQKSMMQIKTLNSLYVEELLLLQKQVAPQS